MDWLWFLLVFAVCGGLWYIAYRIEPHWSTKDGRRFLCNGQELMNGQPVGRMKEVNVVVLGDGTLHITQKRGLRRQRSMWRLQGESEHPPRKVRVYLAQKVENGMAREQMALRLPVKSRCHAVLAEAMGVSAAPSTGTAAPDPQPDRD